MLEDSRKMKLAENFYLHGFDPENGLAWLFNLSTGEIYDLSPVAFFIATHFNGGTEVADIARNLADLYPDQNAEEIKSDLAECIDYLQSIGACVEEKEKRND